MRSESLNTYTELATNDAHAFRDFGDLQESSYATTEAMHAAITAGVTGILKGERCCCCCCCCCV
jgi:hypothetical protein